MRVLITGSNGLLGQKLLLSLKGKPQWELMGVSRREDQLKEPGYEYQKLDITNHHDVEETLHRFKPEVIMNTAAMTDVNQSEREKQACNEVNTEAVKNLVKLCNREGIYLLHLSTDFVFDGSNGPYSEADEPNPLSHYGRSKYNAEQYIVQNSNHWSIVRTILVYGVLPKMPRSNIVLWAKSALEKGEPIRVVSDQFRMPTLVEDLALGCISAAERKAQGIYHICGGEMMSVLEIVMRVGEYFNLDTSIIQPVTSKELSEIAPRPPKTGFVLSKAKQVLDYKPTPFLEGLAMVENQLNDKSSF